MGCNRDVSLFSYWKGKVYLYNQAKFDALKNNRQWVLLTGIPSDNIPIRNL